MRLISDFCLIRSFYLPDHAKKCTFTYSTRQILLDAFKNLNFDFVKLSSDGFKPFIFDCFCSNLKGVMCGHYHSEIH